MSLATIRTEVELRTGGGSGATDAYGVIVDRSINWAQKKLCQEMFMFLRERAIIQVTANTKEYSLPSDFGIFDFLTITTAKNERGSVSTWTQSSGVNGSFDAAIDSDAGAGSIILIGDNSFEIQSVTGDGTSAGSVELDYATSDTAIHLVSDADARTLDKRMVDPSNMNDIFDYPVKSTKDTPRSYHIEGVKGTAGSEVSKIFIGNPTSDAAYMAELWYFKLLADMTDDSDVSLIETVYGSNEPLVALALVKAHKDFKDYDLSAAAEVEAKKAVGRMKRELPYRQRTTSAKAKVGGTNISDRTFTRRS